MMKCTGRRDYRISNALVFIIKKPHVEKSNTVDDTPRELVRLICIAVMLSDPDTHPNEADLCSSLRAEMS